MLFAFTVSLFGIVFAARTFSDFATRNLFARNELTKIGTGMFFAAITLISVLPRAHVSLWFAIFAPMALAMAAMMLLMRKRAADFRAAFAEALSLVSLKMRSGRSFRQAFAEVTAESEPRVRAKLAEIGGAVVFSQQRAALDASPFISAAIAELAAIDRQPHSAARRLEVFRDRLRIENDFRRRSGQVLARIRAQSVVMTGLYVALAIFMAAKFGWQRNARAMSASFALFTIGAAWIWYGGRSLKWKL